jgi:hypothetical protein
MVPVLLMVIGEETESAAPPENPVVGYDGPPAFAPAPPMPIIKPWLTSSTVPGKAPFTTIAGVPVAFELTYTPEPIVTTILLLSFHPEETAKLLKFTFVRGLLIANENSLALP